MDAVCAVLKTKVSDYVIEEVSLGRTVSSV